MITEVWHNPQRYEVRRDPLNPMAGQIAEIWVGTYPAEMGQSVWVVYQELDSSGNLIPEWGTHCRLSRINLEICLFT